MNGRKRDARGFTLIELMIVVAIIGLLAAVAVPSFRNYQFSSKRAEAYANLSALVKSEKSFYAENGAYVGVPLPEPGFTQGSTPSGSKRSVAELSAAFGEVGWTPDGDVFYDYDAAGFGTANGADSAFCACPTCFTATAYGDVDGDGLQSLIVYVQPDENGANWCGTGLFGHAPPEDPGGNKIFNEIVRYTGVGDDY